MTARARRPRRKAIELSQPTQPLGAPAMDVLRECSDLRSSLAAKDAAIAVKKATILVRDVTISELLNDVNAMSQELDAARRRLERLEAQSLELHETRRRLEKFEASATREYEQLKGRLRDLLDHAIPDTATVLVVSGGDDAFLDLNGRRAGHFPQRADGGWNGHPATSREAIDHLETIGAWGGACIVFPAPALWWLDHYDDFRTYLYERCRLVVDRERTAIVFEMPALTRRHDSTQP